MGISKVERLMNLVIALLSTRQLHERGADPGRQCGRLRGLRERRGVLAGCSSATRTNCATWASRWKPVRVGQVLDPTRGVPDQPGRVRAARRRPVQPRKPQRWRWRRSCGRRRSWSGAAEGALLKLRAAGVDRRRRATSGCRDHVNGRNARAHPRVGGGVAGYCSSAIDAGQVGAVSATGRARQRAVRGPRRSNRGAW